MIFDVYTALRHMVQDGKTICPSDTPTHEYFYSAKYNRVGSRYSYHDGEVKEQTFGLDYWVKGGLETMFALYQEPGHADAMQGLIGMDLPAALRHGKGIKSHGMIVDEMNEPETPAKEEPEYVDIEVELDPDNCLSCHGWPLPLVIGRLIERHEKRYFATWYLYKGVDAVFSDPVMVVKGKITFAPHVRFVREDLLGGIPS